MPGADADFTLYEDDSVNYDYEKGTRSTISLHWNDRLHTVSIGNRNGAYPGMIAKRRFTIHLARTRAANDKRAEYTGHKLAVTLE